MTNKSRSKQQKQASNRQRTSVRKNRQNLQKKSVNKRLAQQKRNSKKQTQKKQRQKQSYRKQRQSQKKKSCKKRKQRKQRGGYTMFGQTLSGSFLPTNEDGVFDTTSDFTAGEVINFGKGRKMLEDAEVGAKESEKISQKESVYDQVEEDDPLTKKQMNNKIAERENKRDSQNDSVYNADAEALGDLSEFINDYQALKKRYDEFYDNDKTKRELDDSPDQLTSAEKNKLARLGNEDGESWKENSKLRKTELEELKENSEDRQVRRDARALLNKYENEFKNFTPDSRNDHDYPE